MQTNIASIEFFLVITPGLETLALEELKDKWTRLSSHYKDMFQTEPRISCERGGLNITCHPAEGWLLNAYLKIPTRILQRFAKFKASDVPKLFEKTRKLEWSQYLRDDTILVEASTHSSRLSIEKQIEDVVLSALRDYREHQPLRKKLLATPQTIFVRILHDEVTLSLDTTGEPLFQRGYKTQSVEAPIRESLASAFVFASKKAVTDVSVVMDPMCGSGTFLTEYAGFYSASRARPFSFQNFPCFAQYLPKFQLFDFEKPKFQLLGFDQNTDAVKAAQENLTKFTKTVDVQFMILQKDLFLDDGVKNNALVLINPPFGKRIEVTGGITKYYQSVIDTIIEKYNPLALGVLCPKEVRGLMTRGSYEWIKPPILTNTGGLEVRFEILKRM